jgi:tRNA (cytidine/uridine-2'-O-)-methyltransferase
MSLMLNVALFEPEIPWNTGNIGRTCVAAGAALHLIGKLGFRLDAREIRRSGLDYWPKLSLTRHEDFAAFEAALPPKAPLLLFSTKGRKSFWEAPYGEGCYLLFGRESGGLPAAVMRRHADRAYRIPTTAEVRSLNLSTAVAVVLYEALRRTGL